MKKDISLNIIYICIFKKMILIMILFIKKIVKFYVFYSFIKSKYLRKRIECKQFQYHHDTFVYINVLI